MTINNGKVVRVKHNYIDNREFFLAMEEFYNQTQQAIELGVPENELPIPSNYIGTSIYKIATHMAKRPNFSGYSFIDEMVGDGIEDALLRIRRFNPENAKKNAFGYFSIIIWRAFLRRIAKEKKHSYIRAKAAIDSVVNNSLYDVSKYDDDLRNSLMTPTQLEQLDVFVSEYEQAMKKKQDKITEKLIIKRKEILLNNMEAED